MSIISSILIAVVIVSDLSIRKEYKSSIILFIVLEIILFIVIGMMINDLLIT